VNIIRIIVLILLASVFYACTSSKPISSNKFKGYSKISQGEIATMEWDFANATNVKVDLYDKLYNAVDSAKVSPNSSKEYKITAFHESDTVAYKWTVEVVNKEEKLDIEKPVLTETKPNAEIPAYIPNSTNSEFINGAIGPEAAPVRIKIMHSAKNTNNLELKTIILDENGNFINGLNSEVVDMSFIQKCKKSSNSAGDLQIQEVHKSDGTDYSIIFDNSSVAEFNFPLLERVLNFTESLSQEDRLMFSYFNHNYTEYLSLQPQSEFYNAFKGYDLPKPSGLSGLYKAVYNNLVDFTAQVSKDKNKALILITYSEDNSSLIYSPDDIINAAQNFGIPVFIIAVGDAFNSYTLQKISNSTGGKLYTVHTDSSHIAEHIMKEIDFALNNHYSVTLDYDNNEKECADAYGKLILKYGEKTIEDGIILNPTKSEFHSYYQSVAIFEPKSTEVDNEYEDGIIELANVLKNNPHYRIKLVGHSDDEGSKEFNAEISDSRANNIKKLIVENGVDANQILTGSEGFSKPLYILGQTPWQNNFNRRVELKWINPSQASPFEIVVEQVWTEEEAITSSEKWSKRGYHTYYENYLIGNEPVYRVMLWGFDDEEEAKEVASKIMKKFKTKVTYK
jgi:outer membrane protein OmpA-like peptidoglycan-associated protein